MNSIKSAPICSKRGYHNFLIGFCLDCHISQQCPTCQKPTQTDLCIGCDALYCWECKSGKWIDSEYGFLCEPCAKKLHYC